MFIFFFFLVIALLACKNDRVETRRSSKLIILFRPLHRSHIYGQGYKPECIFRHSGVFLRKLHFAVFILSTKLHIIFRFASTYHPFSAAYWIQTRSRRSKRTRRQRSEENSGERIENRTGSEHCEETRQKRALHAFQSGPPESRRRYN